MIQDRGGGDPTAGVTAQDLGIGRLFWAMRDAVVVGEATTGRIVLVNPAAERLFGYSASELIGQLIELLVPDALKPHHRVGLIRYATTGRGPLIDAEDPVEVPARHRDGTELTIELTLAPIGDGPSAGRFVFAMIRDATARKQAEAERLALAQEHAARVAAEAAQARLAFLADASAALAASLDYEATLAMVARLAVPMLGSWSVVYFRESNGRIRRLAVAATDPDRAGLTDEIERRFQLDLDAETGVVRVIRTGRSELDAAGTVASLTGDVVDPVGLAQLLEEWDISSWMCVPLTVRDETLGALSFVADRGRRYTVDDLALAEELAHHAALAIDNARLYAEARAAETSYRGVFEGVADAILVADRGGYFQDANPAALALLEYDSVALCDLCIADVVAQPSWTEVEAQLLGTQRWRGDLELRRRDGTCIPVEAFTALVDLPDGTVYLMALRDVSERHRLERLQRDFLAMVTHDLRTPLTIMRTSVQLLQRRQAYRAAQVEAMAGAVDRMQKLTDDLADMIRLEGGQLTLRRAPVDLTSLVREQVSAVIGEDDRWRVTVEAPPGPVVGPWDADRLGQVLSNLLTNAIKYTPNGTPIEVRIEERGKESWLTVADQGSGIEAEHLPLLFERFYRVGATGAGGLGLGLYISRMLVEAHGGRIWAEATLGQGTAFTVVLPRS